MELQGYLTIRQNELVQHVANGLILKQAAYVMGIEYNTAIRHMKLALKRTNTHTQAHLVAECFRRKVIL